MTATAPAATSPETKTLPVMEIFGGVVQGEGILAGAPTYFVRFGGCEFRCDWCDSMFAVEPAQVRAHARRLSAEAIVAELAARGLVVSGPRWVTLSGGNPALLKLGLLCLRLHEHGARIAVETQGARWRDWLADVDCLTVSPKAPSSGMVSDAHTRQFHAFMAQAERLRTGRQSGDCLKIVVFDQTDLDWARDVFKRYPAWPGFLSVGTPPVGTWGNEAVKGVSARQARNEIGEGYAWLCEQVASDADFADVRALPQLHVVAFGHLRGV